MKTVLVSAAAALVLSGCGAMMRSEHHAAHHAAQQPAATPADSAAQAAQADQQLKLMQDMHQKMMSAKTPQERQALMADHMKAMQGGISMMCQMGMGQMGPAAGAQGRGPGMGMGMGGMPQGSGQQDMMQRCMAMRDMTMRMMMDRDAAASAPK